MGEMRLISKQILTNIADALRTKTNSDTTTKYKPSQMAEIINNLEIEPADPYADIPNYVQNEAMKVVNLVKGKQAEFDDQGESYITFVAGSDSHLDDYTPVANETLSNSDSSTKKIYYGNLHGGQALRILVNEIQPDFCAYLGDYTNVSSSGITEEKRLSIPTHIDTINSMINSAFEDQIQFRTIGNHDKLYQPNGVTIAANIDPTDETLSDDIKNALTLYNKIGKYSIDNGAIGDSVNPYGGYSYKDFTNPNIRVICLNTADPGVSGSEGTGTRQKEWLVDTLRTKPTEFGTEDYGILILSHEPIDWGSPNFLLSDLLRAFIEGGTYGSYDFSSSDYINKSAWLLTIHGHVHTFKDDNLHYLNNGSPDTYDVKKISIPNMSFHRNNEYGQNSGTEYGGVEYGNINIGNSCNKQAITNDTQYAKDTSLAVFLINTNTQQAYRYCFGACGNSNEYRTEQIYFGRNAVPVESISLNLDTAVLHPGETLRLTPTVLPTAATNKRVIWSSSNNNIASINNGLITAGNQEGTVTITATTQDGNLSATCVLAIQYYIYGNLRTTTDTNVKVTGTNNHRISGTTGASSNAEGKFHTSYINLLTPGFLRPIDQSNIYEITIRIKGADFYNYKNPNAVDPITLSNSLVFYGATELGEDVDPKYSHLQGYIVYLTSTVDSSQNSNYDPNDESTAWEKTSGNSSITKKVEFFADPNNSSLGDHGIIQIKLRYPKALVADNSTHKYIRISGTGSFDNIDIRINEDFD